MKLRPLDLALFALAACVEQADDPADTDAAVDDGPPIDARVDSYVPEGLTPAEPVRIVFLGDSITAGAGAGRSSLDYVHLLQENDGDKWPGFDDVDLETSFPSVAEVVDVSQGGATTASLLATQIPALKARLGDLPAEGATLVVFTIGGNDAQQALNPFADAEQVVDATLDNFRAIVEELQSEALFAEPPAIFATNIYEPTDGVGQADDCFLGIDFSSALPQLERANVEVRDMGEELGFAVLDLRGHFLGHGYHNEDAALGAHVADDPTRWFYEDCIHPNNRGHHELRRLVHAALLGEPLRVVRPDKD